jgi:hypothetical protein
VSPTRRLATTAALLAAMGCAATLDSPAVDPLTPGSDRPAHVLLISVSGLTADRYRDADMRLLRELAAVGASATAVESVMPATRYPAHATLLSGQPPSTHGIAANRLLGSHGVRATPYWHVSHLRAPTLWQMAIENGRRVLALGWPSTVGAEIGQLIPDQTPRRAGETWLGVLADSATPHLLVRAASVGGTAVAVNQPGKARDAVLTTLACEGLQSAEPPNLLLLHLSQAGVALRDFGPDADEVAAAFTGVDAEITRLLGCLAESQRLQLSAVLVVGDHGTIDVHTGVAPNVLLAQDGLIHLKKNQPNGIERWSAIARSNGGSAFVYARTETDAVEARRVLAALAESTRAFRVISAAEMMSLGADPGAWFGLEARLGFAFADAVRGAVLRPAATRGAGGYLPERDAMDAGFVAWGRGIRTGVRIPHMRLVDVAPTAARLMGFDLGEVDGRVLIGALESPPGVSSGGAADGREDGGGIE